MPDPFVSRQDLSDRLGRDVTSDAGALSAVDAACEICRTLAEQDFDFGTETITLDGTGTDCLLLPQLPAANAGTVVVNGGTVTDYVLADNGRLIRKVTDTTVSSSWWQGFPNRAVWPEGRQNVVVTYDHGFAGTVPSDVREVALDLALRLVVQGAAVQEQVGDTSIRYAGAANELTNNELRILRKYRPIR